MQDYQEKRKYPRNLRKSEAQTETGLIPDGFVYHFMCGCSETPGCVYTVIIRTAGTAAFLRLHTESAGEIHPKLRRKQRGHTFQAGGQRSCRSMFSGQSHDVKWLVFETGNRMRPCK